MKKYNKISTKKNRKQIGFTLIELLVAMAMGLAMIAVVLSAFLSMTTGNRVGTSQQQLNEDAQAAFQILGQQIRNAGFNPIQPRVNLPEKNLLNTKSTNPLTPEYVQPLTVGVTSLGVPITETTLGVFGCATGFSNASGATPAAHISALTCNAAGGSPSIAVQYEADQYSPNLSGITPADCRGFAVPQMKQQTNTPTTPPNPAGDVSFYMVENRYFIANGGLSCTGNGTKGVIPAFGTPTQPLVGNIESMQIDYGVLAPGTVDDAARFPSGYISATALGAASGLTATGVDAAFTTAALKPGFESLDYGSQRWALVNTVRICLVVKSATATLTDKIKDAAGVAVYGYYSGCNPTDSTQINITDQFMRKSYTMHFTMRSRINTPK